jgi:ComF family protein
MKQITNEPLTFTMGEMLAELWQKRRGNFPSPDIILGVPMHWSRRWLRGINSCEVLAERMACRLLIPVVRGLLVSCRKAKKQGTLTTPQRFQNVRGAFRLSTTYDITGSKILLLDDIMTTGATASEAAKVLRRGGAASVDVAVVARGVGRGWQAPSTLR